MAGCSCCASFQAEGLASISGFWEMGEQHGRCRWEGLRAQDSLLQRQPSSLVQKQRNQCRQLIDGELDWEELLGAK